MRDDDRRSEERRVGGERRESMGTGANDWSQGLPGWVRAVALVGLPGVLCFLFIWMGWRDLTQINTKVDSIFNEVLRNRALIEQQALRADDQLKLLRWICSNTAKSDEERRRCFD